MITTIKTNITWEGVPAKAIFEKSEKKIEGALKEMTGAIDVEILDIDSWDDDKASEE